MIVRSVYLALIFLQLITNLELVAAVQQGIVERLMYLVIA